jgi:multidrug resistance protein
MLCIALVAVDSTVVATVVPSVVGQLGGFAQFPWLFSAYVLTQAVTTPLYGRFADQRGRRPVLLFGVTVFGLGSLICAGAWSMPVLIAGRAAQGLGAGAILPVALTVVGDLYSVAERSRVQGYIASVWAASAVLGPTVGGLSVAVASWRWVFVVNLPLGALAGLVLRRALHETVELREHRIDYAGAALLVASSGLIILGLLEGGVSWPWGSAASAAVLGIGAALLIVFVVVQARVAEPLLPLWVLRRRTLVAGILSQTTVGMVIIGLTSYVPTFVQGVLGGSALVAGFAVATLTLGWPVSASLAGRLYLRIGFRDTAVLGAVIALATMALGLRWGVGSSVVEVAAVCFAIGVGMGFASVPILVAVQSVVGWSERGVVTSSALFARSLGSALGAALFGALANTSLAGHLAQAPPAVAAALPDGLDAATLALGGQVRAASAQAVEFVRDGLAGATHQVMIALVLVTLVQVLLVAAIPRVVRTPDGAPVIDSDL